MSLVPALANGFKVNPSAADLERRNAASVQYSLLGVGVHTRVKKNDDGSVEVIVFRCTNEFCTRIQYLCNEDFCAMVKSSVQDRVASLYALEELEQTHVVFEGEFRKPIQG